MEKKLWTLISCIKMNMPRSVCCNDPKFLDRHVWANSINPDQNAHSSSLIRMYIVCQSVYIFWMHYFMVKNTK